MRSMKLIPLALAGFLAMAAAEACGGGGGDNDTGTDPAVDDQEAADPAREDGAADPLPEAEIDGTEDVRPEAPPDAADGGDQPGTCTSDSQCTAGEQWCVAGSCVPCDNSAPVCDIECTHGWQTYMRNGCLSCECAPLNQCNADSECDSSGPAMKCYAGAFCWDWCPAGDPGCCMGNICSAAGCEEPPPVGCFTRGCPRGESCVPEGCESSGCSCDSSSGSWGCLADCSGGTCVSPP